MKWLPPLASVLMAVGSAAAQTQTKLTADAQAKLDAHGLVVVDRPLRQGFSAYLGSEHPVFITSDSLLMAYHRIFDEVVGEIEAGQLVGFRLLWHELWNNLPTDPGKDADDATKEGLRRARLLMATAARLLTGDLPEGLSEAETAAVTAEVERVEKGVGIAPPPWILSDPKPEDHVSYAAFQSGGLFEGRETMERYYRFRKWLQEMQVDPSDKSTIAMLGGLGIAVAKAGAADETLKLLAPFGSPFAPGDFEPGLLNRLPEICDRMGNDSIREVSERVYNGIAIASHHRLFGVLHPGGSKITRKLTEMSSLPAYHGSRTPEAVGFALGNTFAGSLLDPSLAEATTQCGDFAFSEDEPLPAIGYFYRALRELNSPPDDRAPALFRSNPWRSKQLNATLGSWTEHRHALLLGSREDAHYFGLTAQEPGYVEPVPAFYRWLGESAEALETSRIYLHSTHQSQGAWVVRLEDVARNLKRMRDLGGNHENREVFELNDALRPYTTLLRRLSLDQGHTGTAWFSFAPEDSGRAGEGLDRFVKSWWAGDPEARRLLEAALTEQLEPVGPRLLRLAGVCFRLEAMAERQLASQPWTNLDRGFLNNYGATLGWLMFYEGNSYLTPRDDAPRIVRYASLTDGSTARVFHAATSQPRLLLIRYPDREGRDVLCQGAVYAYRDVESDHTPTKQEWQAEAKTSAWPEWMKPVVGSYEPPAEKKE